MTHPVDVVVRFMTAINARDVAALTAQMSDDHIFVDSLGNAMVGRDTMIAGWQGYFALCPDYWLTHDTLMCEGDMVGVFGAAGGTIRVDGQSPPENAWRVNAAWLARVEGGKVARWQVFADNKPVYDILARSPR